MGHGHVDFTKAIESIPGRTVPVQVKIIASALIVIGIVASVYAFATDPTRAGGALITNFMYFNGIAIGGFMLTPITLLTHSRWPRRLKRFSEALGLFMPLMGLSYCIFLLAGGVNVYPWVAENEAGLLLAHKTVYLQPGFFIARQIFCQSLLAFLALRIIQSSLRADLAHAKAHLGDRTPTGFPWNMFSNLGSPEEETKRSQAFQLSRAPGFCILYALLYTVVAVDVSMSLAPHWYANMFPAWVFMSSIWSGLVYIALFSLLTRDWLGVKELLPSNVYHDLGKLTFAFCMFWGYTTFAQYLPIWYGNMTEEIGFILLRIATKPWQPISQAVFLLCFLAPWTILLSRGLKKIPSAYIAVACVMAVGIWLERYLVNVPSIYADNIDPDFAAPFLLEIGMGLGFLGALILFVTSFLARVPGATISDPFMQPDPDHVHVIPSSQANSHH
jgi:hypothetical protein